MANAEVSTAIKRPVEDVFALSRAQLAALQLSYSRLS